jgi:penicillin-binding protein 1A
LRDHQSIGFLERLKRFALDLDARIDSGLFFAGRWFREIWERFTTFMDRFHVASWKRWCVVEPFSEGMTWGLGGLILALALALPAFHETSDEDWLKKSELAVVFLDRYGNEVGARGIKHNDSIPLEDFPDHLIKATLATEDRRFYEHFGIDIPGTFRALLANTRAGGVVQGGSSITQQLAKNLFLSNERTIERKVKEAFLAIWLETRLKKNEILKLYLDRAYLGGGAFGVDAAAQYYFAKSARDVNLAEAAMLAGLFKAPTRFAPHINLPAARARANTVLDNLIEAGFMTEGQVFGARRNPASAIDRRDERQPNYYLDTAFEEMKKLADKLPKNVTERVFVVRTGLDVNLQRQAENAVEEMLRLYGRQYGAKQAGTVVMENDGTVRAIVGGRDYASSQFNRATDAQRQPGSSFKPYVYSGGYSGSVTMQLALTKSINIIPVKLSVAVGNGNARAGRAKIVALAKQMGLRSPLPDTPSLPIGADEVTIFDHTAAYATFPNGGKAVTPHTILEVRNATGDLIWRFDRDGPKPRQVMPQQVAADINMILNKAVEEGTGRRSIIDGVKSAGKTGTTNAYRDAWFVGYTGNMVCGVWYGNDDYAPTNRMTGGSLPAMTWKKIMGYAHQGIELRTMPGVAPSPGPVGPPLAADETRPGDEIPKPTLLTKRGTDLLIRLEKSFEDASRALAKTPARGRTAETREGPPQLAAGERPNAVRGN